MEMLKGSLYFVPCFSCTFKTFFFSVNGFVTKHIYTFLCNPNSFYYQRLLWHLTVAGSHSSNHFSWPKDVLLLSCMNCIPQLFGWCKCFLFKWCNVVIALLKIWVINQWEWLLHTEQNIVLASTHISPVTEI